MGKVIRVREIGNPILNEKCEKIDCKNINEEVLDIIDDLIETLQYGTGLGYEGCMSIPQIRGKVKRYKEIELTYYNEKGEKIVKQVSGFFARLVQHECDHLDGITFIEKVEPGHSFATKEMITKFNLRNI